MAYPQAIDVFTTLIDNVDIIQAAHPNSRGTAITNIETALGTYLKNVLPVSYANGITASPSSGDGDHDIDFGAIKVREDAGVDDIEVDALTKQFDATFAAGTNAGGMQSGSSLANNTGYYVYAIDDSSRVLSGDIMAVPIGTSFSYPSGYDVKRLISFFSTNGSANIYGFSHNDILWTYDAWITLASGSPGTSWASLDLTNRVPANLSTYCFGTLYSTTSGARFMTNDNSLATTTGTKRNQVQAASAEMAYSWQFETLTANTLYWRWTDGSGNGAVYLNGFLLNKLRT